MTSMHLQLATPDEHAFVSIWHVISASCEQVCRLMHPAGSRGVYSCSFSKDSGGTFLVTATGDNRNTIRVWDWKLQRVLAEEAGYQGVPPQVFGSVWDEHSGRGQGRHENFHCIFCFRFSQVEHL
jgi:WD40 repeat protein